eukprot:6474358-Amphidinium_carterae.2
MIYMSCSDSLAAVAESGPIHWERTRTTQGFVGLSKTSMAFLHGCLPLTRNSVEYTRHGRHCAAGCPDRNHWQMDGRLG